MAMRRISWIDQRIKNDASVETAADDAGTDLQMFFQLAWDVAQELIALTE
jgi:hypothetical protein